MHFIQRKFLVPAPPLDPQSSRDRAGEEGEDEGVPSGAGFLGGLAEGGVHDAGGNHAEE